MTKRQLFNVAGITTTVADNVTKVRFSDNSVRRIKQYTKDGSSRIDFVELPSKMTKIDAIKFLMTHADFQSPSDQATLAETLENKEIEAKKATKASSVTVSKEKAKDTVKTTSVSIKARATPKSWSLKVMWHL